MWINLICFTQLMPAFDRGFSESAVIRYATYSQLVLSLPSVARLRWVLNRAFNGAHRPSLATYSRPGERAERHPLATPERILIKPTTNELRRRTNFPTKFLLEWCESASSKNFITQSPPLQSEFDVSKVRKLEKACRAWFFSLRWLLQRARSVFLCT